jgi:hypothetical protein
VSHLVKPSSPELWGQRIDEMGLRLDGSPLHPLIQQLYAELESKGISFRPPCYVANEWGCPDGVPLIGLPFYLVDSRFHSYEEEHADDLEDAPRIMTGLRHEAGHAINYAYRLYEDAEWRTLFGDFFSEYGDDYRPTPFSKRFVRHLPGWYSQKHPDEDFAETFAVWMTPGLDWRSQYQGWAALAKLEYMDRLMQRIGRTEPVFDMTQAVPPDPDELAFTVGEFYELRAEEDTPPVEELGTHLDDDLRQIFCAEGIGTDAATLLWENRQVVMNSVSNYAGSRMYVVKAIIDNLTGRLRALGLRAHAGKEIAAMAAVTALISTLVHNFLSSGHLLPEAA